MPRLLPLVAIQALVVAAVLTYVNVIPILVAPQRVNGSGLLTLLIFEFTVIYGLLLILAMLADRRSSKFSAILLLIAEAVLLLLNRPSFINLESNPGGVIINTVTTLAAVIVMVAVVIKLRARKTP